MSSSYSNKLREFSLKENYNFNHTHQRLATEHCHKILASLLSIKTRKTDHQNFGFLNLILLMGHPLYHGPDSYIYIFFFLSFLVQVLFWWLLGHDIVLYSVVDHE